MTPLTVALLAFDQMEALDFAGPFEVFTTAARMHARMQAEAGLSSTAPALFNVISVARTLAPVAARAGLRVLPDASFDTSVQADLLVVPGGVIEQAMRCPDTLDWVQRQHTNSLRTASVCTGAFILAAARVLTSGLATTHWEDLTDLRQRFPALEVVDSVQWVQQGRLVTSAGISAGIAMSLHLVAEMASAQGINGMDLALRTARQMEYDWRPQP
jgi:transcriptional regulator GlxA family with amidase domain